MANTFKFVELHAMQKYPLARKVEIARRVIKDALAEAQKPVVAFSGGKDSTVLMYLMLEQCSHIAAIFSDTGVEYPESRKFVFELRDKWDFELHVAKPARTKRAGYKYAAQRRILEYLVQQDRVDEILKADGKLKTTLSLERACPAALQEEFAATRQIWRKGTRQSYWWGVDQYGYPLLGKAFSRLGARRINIDCFLRYSHSISVKPKLLAYYDVLRHVKISQMCCDFLKKEPARRVQKEIGADTLFKGLMAAESRTRAVNFLSRGYVFDGKIRHVNPMSIWTDDDVWDFIHQHNLPYAEIYDMGIPRNGCMGCATDIMYDDNHMMTLRRTHPKAWQTFMRHGMAEQIRNLQRYLSAKNGQASLFSFYPAEYLLETRPCAFDRVQRVAWG